MFQLEHKFQTYLELIKSEQDANGFVESHECDSLLFTGLVGCVPGFTVDIDSAFDKQTGQWHRRPTDCPCYPNGSKSSISRDMLLGLCWYAYFNKRKDILEQVIKHALKNFGIMGQAADWQTVIGRCFIGPGLLATYAAALHALGGKNYWYLKWMPADVGAELTGFQAHLQVLHILLREEITGKISTKNAKTLIAHAKRQPNNPLFRYAVQDHFFALNLLTQENLWPSERLPKVSDRKAQWIPQRDEGEDWQPAKSKHVHSGGDFLFCYWLISKKFSKSK